MTAAFVRAGLVVALTGALPYPVDAADIIRRPERDVRERHSSPPLMISGPVSVIDGRTLHFPHGGHVVRLASIDACELPQWSYDPRRHGDSEIPKPVPCGPLAKAWLKRSVGGSAVRCAVESRADDGSLFGHCMAGRRDLALEMLRVGWARVISPAPAHYVARQNYAISARYGMWTTYVLEMAEWRAKAVDRTLSRQPIADFNLLADRNSEISPPFDDARKRPLQTDR
jgi:endonuclease YncB( thermonuclease family)